MSNEIKVKVKGGTHYRKKDDKPIPAGKIGIVTQDEYEAYKYKFRLIDENPHSDKNENASDGQKIEDIEKMKEAVGDGDDMIEKLLSHSVSDIKSFVRADVSIDLERMLVVEKANKDRKTLVNFLESRIEDQEEVEGENE